MNGLLRHSDCGSQYASESHQAALKQRGARQSMSRKGNYWDNTVSESFFHTLKMGLTHHQIYQNQDQAKRAVFECIEIFYRLYSRWLFVAGRLRIAAQNCLMLYPEKRDT